MESKVFGESVITAAGINAIVEAQSRGRKIAPKYFRYSEEEIVLDPMLEAKDFSGWITKDIDIIKEIDNNTLEITCDVLPDSANRYTRAVGVFLEDGTLFAVAKPPFPYPPKMRQTFKLQITYEQINNVVDFKYVGTNIEEKEAIILDSAITNFLFNARLTKVKKIEGVRV